MLLSRTRWLSRARVQTWVQDGVLQLQRQISQAEGAQKWERLDREVPVVRGSGDQNFLVTADKNAVFTTIGPSEDVAAGDEKRERWSGSEIGRLFSRGWPRTLPANAATSRESELVFSNTLDEVPGRTPARVA